MSAKTELVFFIVDRRHDWIVRAEGFVYGPYASFADALTGAICEAQAAGLLGFASVVLAQPAVFRPYQTQWAYGRDAYLPPPSDEVRHASPHL